MEKLFKNSKRWMTTFGVVAFLMVAGWQVGADGTGEVFSETEVALENAVAGSIECKWKIISCGPFSGSYEACLTNGDGNSCTCGTTTRDC